MQRMNISAGIVLVLVLGGCLGTPIEDVPYQHMLDVAVAEGLPGIVLLVRTPDVAFLGVSGYADTENKVPMNTDHLFRIASTSKSFIGVLSVILHCEGVIDLDDPITEWLPSSITSRIQYADTITVRQLLNHTSGTYDYCENAEFQQAILASPEKHWSAEDALSYAFDQPAYFESGTDWYYSNTNYVLAGLVLDNALGYHHSQAIRTRILEPLDMMSTFYEHHEDARGYIIHGYSDYDRNGTLDDITFDQGYGLADSGLVSTAGDLAVFIESLFKNDDFPSFEYKDEFMAELLPGEEDFYGLGIMKYPTEYGIGYGNGGRFCGYESQMIYFPDHDVVIVYFVNGTGSSLERITDDFFNRILEKIFSERGKIRLSTGVIRSGASGTCNLCPLIPQRGIPGTPDSWVLSRGPDEFFVIDAFSLFWKNVVLLSLQSQFNLAFNVNSRKKLQWLFVGGEQNSFVRF